MTDMQKHKGILSNDELSSYLDDLHGTPYRSNFQRWHQLLYACHYTTNGKGLPAFIYWCKKELNLGVLIEDAQDAWRDINNVDSDLLIYDAFYLADELAKQGKSKLKNRLNLDEPAKINAALKRLVNNIQMREEVSTCIDEMAAMEYIPHLMLYETLLAIKERTEIPITVLKSMYESAVIDHKSSDLTWPSYTRYSDGRVKPKATFSNFKYFCSTQGVEVLCNHMSQELNIKFQGEFITELHLFDLMNEAGLSGYRQTLPAMLRSMSRENIGYHPVKAWLRPATWDGVDRIDTLMTKLNVRRCPPDLLRIYLTRWLLGGIEAVYNDNGLDKQSMLVLHGKPACGKTTFFESLIPEDVRHHWFTPNVREPWNANENKHAVISWLTEVSNLHELLLYGHAARGRRRTLIDMSEHLDSGFDTPRRRERAIRRHFYCAGITALEPRLPFAVDRRYFVLPIHDIKFNLEIDAQQLWLQVKQLYDDGQRHLLLKSELKRHNEYGKVLSTHPHWITNRKRHA